MSTTLHRASGRASRPARATRATAGPTPRWVLRRTFSLGVCAGMTIALAISAVAFFTTRPEPVRRVASGAGSGATGADGGHGAHEAAGNNQPAGAPAAAIDITATHLGDLKVLIDVLVSAPTTYDPITMAQVSAYTDMVAMPMSHRSSPLTLTETPGRPGHYETLATVPMMGEYDITVEVTAPMSAQAHKRINVTSVEATKP